MKELHYLFAGFAAAWCGVFLYLLRLSALRRRLEGRMERLLSVTGEEGP